VEQHDISILGLAHYFRCDFLRRALVLVLRHAPVVRVNALAHDQVTQFLRVRQLLHFFRIFRLVIDAVWRTEKEWT